MSIQLAAVELQNFDSVHIPNWLETKYAMYTLIYIVGLRHSYVDETVAENMEAEIRAFWRRVNRIIDQAGKTANKHEAHDNHVGGFQETVNYVMDRLIPGTVFYGYTDERGGRKHTAKPTTIANLMAVENPFVTPAHVRMAQEWTKQHRKPEKPRTRIYE